MKKIILLLLFIPILFGCKHKKHKEGTYHKVTCYKQQGDDGSWLLYYMIMSSNNNMCYYATSPTAVTNFSSLDFKQSSAVPIDTKEAELVSEQPVEQAEFNDNMQAEFADNASYFGGMTEEEMGNYETNENTESESQSSESSESSSESSSDSGSDSGGGDSGGGDSGGGDGGGGGGGD